NRIARATLRSSWRDSRGGYVSFRNLALWRLRLKRGLPVQGTGDSICGNTVGGADCAWTWLVRSRKVLVMTMNGAGLERVRETLARLGGKGPRVRLERSAAKVVELRSGGDVSARVDRWFLQEGQVGSGPDVTPPMVVDFVIPPLRRGTGGNGYEAPVPEIFTTPVAYHAVGLRRDFRDSRGAQKRNSRVNISHFINLSTLLIGVQEKKDKIGERVSKLQQLVSPFGKVPPLAPPSSLLMLQQQSLLGDKAVSMAGAERSLSADDSDEGDGGELTLPSITPPSIKGSIRTGDNNSLPWHSFMLMHISCDVI
ncbi:hypothetical protein GW17_00051285, partial [Ensete ventricosum]